MQKSSIRDWLGWNNISENSSIPTLQERERREIAPSEKFPISTD